MVKESTLLQRLINEGVEVTDPRFQEALAEAEQAAVDVVPEPVKPADQELPDWFKSLRSSIFAAGRLTVLLQVIFIQGFFGAAINVALIVVDTILITHVYTLFQPSWLVATLMGATTIVAYTYLSFSKAQTKFALYGGTRKQFTLADLKSWWAYFTGKDTTPRYRSSLQDELRFVSRVHTLFLITIFILRVLEAYINLYHAQNPAPGVTPAPVPEIITGAVASILSTIVFLVVLEIQIDRSYRAYRESDAEAVNTADFFAARWSEYLEEKERRRIEARRLFLAARLTEVQRLKALPSNQETPPSPSQITERVLPQNGNGSS